MTTSDIPELTVSEAVAALARKEFTPAEYVEALLERQSRWPTLNAYTQQDPEAARRAASNPAPGPLSGIPVAIKDNIDVAGYCTTAGTPGLKDHRPMGNAPLVQKIVDSGAIVMGKLGLHEMAAGGTCANITFGPVRNPYDLSRVPGGSSGGSGAAVAARLVPAALGTDTAGSVRAPAAMCGVVGFRPTTGRYSRVGLVPGDLRRDTMGWLARSVADVILLDHLSAVTPPAPVGPVSLRGLRLGLPRDFFFAHLDLYLAAVINSSLAALEAAGAELVEVDVPDLRDLLTAATAIRGSQVHSLGVYMTESGGSIDPVDIIHAVADAPLRAGMERGLGANNPAEPDEGPTRALQAAYSAYFRDNNLAAMVFPTVPEPAYLSPDDYLAGGTGPTAMIRNTLPGARAGVPGLTVPAGLTRGGLPVGLELDGPAGADATVLEIGRAFEAIIPPLPAPGVTVSA